MAEGMMKDHKLQNTLSLFKRSFLWTFYSLVGFFLLGSWLVQRSPLPSSNNVRNLNQGLHHLISVDKPNVKGACDLFKGHWEPDYSPLLYTDSTCKTIKEGQNCIAHGRPDTGYLQWRWRPSNCTLPRFNPETFLLLAHGQKLLFVGDSLARNQLESLLCLLSQSSQPILINSDTQNKTRSWFFPSYNFTISVIWSPFLVKGIEKSYEEGRNKLFVDSMDEKWSSELKDADMVVLSVGHWFLHPALFYEGNQVLGCHHCPGMNHTEIGFFEVLRKAVRTSLRGILGVRRKMNVVVTTFSPAHFDGEWDKAGACDKKEPYKEREKELGWTESELRKIEIEEIEGLKGVGSKWGLRFEALDVTMLANMRPDAHPGPYMNAFPFAGGVKDRVQNDCVHWCLPGAIDTWNELLLEMMKRWKRDEEER